MELLSKLKYYLVLLTIFLVPIAFNPFASDIFNSIKGLILLFSSGLILFLWGIDAYLSKKLKLKLSWVNSLVLIIFAVSILNVVANTPLISSWFGQGSLTGITTTIFGNYGTLGLGFLTLTALTIFFFSASLSINSEKRIEQVLRVLSASAVFAVILSLIRYALPSVDLQTNSFNIIFKGYGIVNPSFPTLYPAQNFSPIGEYYLMPIFTLICIIFELYLINLHSSHKKSYFKYIDYAFLVILVAGFVITSAMTIYSYESFSIFPYAFYILGGLVLAFIIFRSIRGNALIKTSKRKLYTPFIAVGITTLVSAIVVFLGKLVQIASPLSPLSVSWSSTFAALGSSLKNGFFGIGAENFSVAYLQNRPVGVNNTNLIFETLSRAGNFVLEIISNFGLLGLGAFIFVSLKIILYILKTKNLNDPFITMLSTVLFVLFVSFFLLPINLTMLFVVFVVLMLLASVNNDDSVNIKNVVVAFRSSNAGGALFSTRNLGERAADKNIAHLLFVGLATIIFLASTIFAYNLYMAQSNYANSYKHTNLADSNELDAAINDTANAIQQFGYADNFYNRYAALVFQKLSNAVTKANDRIQKENKETNPTDDPNKRPQLTSQEQSEIQGYLTSMQAGLDKATQTNPLNYENYYLTSRIYFELAKTGSNTQYLQQAADNVNLALRLNPQNPTLYILAANIYALNNDAGNARNALVTSINKFPTLDAFAQLAQLYRNLKQYDAAIDTLKSAQQFVQKDSDTYKQIDDAIKTVTDDKAKDPDANKPIQSTGTTVPATSTPTPTPSPTATPKPTVTPTKKP